MKSYADQGLNAVQTLPLKGNDSATMLLTPQKGTGSETKTHTTTCKFESMGRKAILKKLVYLVETAQTGAGNNLAIDIYKNGASAGSLSVTTETAGTPCVSSALDIELAAADSIRLYLKSTTTASDANCAIGNAYALYSERYA